MERARLGTSPPAAQGSSGVSAPSLYPLMAGYQGGLAALWTCSCVFSAEGRSSPGCRVERGQAGHSSVHGPLQESLLSPTARPPSPSQSPRSSTAYQPILCCHMSLPLPLHFPPLLVLFPPTTVKQHPRLTNPSLPPGFSPQPTTCCHLSLLLPHPSQQQLTNCRVRETAMSQSGAVTCQLCQPIRDSHTPPRCIKVPQGLDSVCLRLLLGGRVMYL